MKQYNCEIYRISARSHNPDKAVIVLVLSIFNNTVVVAIVYTYIKKLLTIKIHLSCQTIVLLSR